MYDKYGFDKDWIHQDTNMFVNRNMFKKDKKNLNTGTFFDEDGYDIDWYNKFWFDKDNIHKKTGTIYDEEGYNRAWYNDRLYNREWFTKEGKHKDTQSKRNTKGFDCNGKYNPNFDTSKKRKSDELCPICSGTRKESIRVAHHQASDSQNEKIFCKFCNWTGKHPKYQK